VKLVEQGVADDTHENHASKKSVQPGFSSLAPQSAAREATFPSSINTREYYNPASA